MNYRLLNVDKEYISVYGEIASSIIIEKKSKFLSYIFNVESEKEAKKYIEKVRINNTTARHIVYVYSILNTNILKYCDDKEPTATNAILQLLNKECICNICIVIVRYFGGIMLGCGPLARAYLNVFKQSLKLCNKSIIFTYIKYENMIDYSKYKLIESMLKHYEKDNIIQICDIKFSDNVYLELNIHERYFDNIIKILE
ncbi:MAG: YigZ family protein [Clostridia bacterium]